jgi:predicted nucleic-acid-binding Zn-ribbon protein
MKKSQQCPKCRSIQVGHLEDARAHSVGVMDRNQQIGETDDGARVGWVGGFEAYVCLTCGFYELYVKEVAAVPFDQLTGFRRLNAGHPYRE